MFACIRFTVVLFMLVLLLSACSKEDDDGGVDLSGTINVFQGSAIDSDTNDPDATYQANDVPAQAQPIIFPLTLGGYVNQPGAGETGRSFSIGDVHDYFETNLFAGQVISLNIADIGNLNSPSNNLNLYLFDEAGTVLIDSSTSNTKRESITVAQDGNYIIRVTAVQGASAYNLSVGFDSSISGLFNSRFSSSSLSQSTAPAVERDFIPGQMIVRFKQAAIPASAALVSQKTANLGLRLSAGARDREMLWTVADIKTSFQALGIKQSSNTGPNGTLNSKQNTLAIINSLKKRSDIEYAMPNYIVRAAQVPNDSGYGLQWHYPLINLPQAWDISTGSADVIVAVVDTGVLLNHPDLQGQLVNGYDFVLNRNGVDNERDGEPGIDNNPDDPGDGINGPSSFHGTHVAGTIAAASNNGIGAAGVAWNVKIMPLRVLGPYDGNVYDIGQAVRYAAGLENDSGTTPAQPADVINLSLGGITTAGDLEILKEPFELARNAGSIIVAAAGNDGQNTLYYPASIDGVVSVSATNISRQLASYSNFGPTVDVSAPGGDSGDVNGDGFFDGVYSLSGDDSNGLSFTYKFATGTSMAAPHVAGVAALMKSIFPDLTPDQFDLLLQNGDITRDLGALGRDDLYGHGLIDAEKAALAAVQANSGVLPQRDPEAAVFPDALSFSYDVSSRSISMSNAGDGDLSVTSISNDSGGWITVQAVNADVNGLGDYDVVINRDMGPADLRMATATITIATTENQLSIPVIVQMEQVPFADQAGRHYILLLDGNRQPIYETRVNGNNGVYNYRFKNIKSGTYFIIAGSDINNDDRICDPGEACGEYPTLDDAKPITVNQHTIHDLGVAQSGTVSKTDRRNVNFETGYHLNIGASHAISRKGSSAGAKNVDN